MNTYIGRTWGSLSISTKNILLKQANCVDGNTCNNAKLGDCIIDLTYNMSINGKINEDNEIIISEHAVIYCPT